MNNCCFNTVCLIWILNSIPRTTTLRTGELSECAGCKEDLKEGQVLVALEKSWHIWCFKCHTCGSVLHGEYMGKDGVPYCERDYQKQFGVKCAYCNRYISGKVLQVSVFEIVCKERIHV